MREAQTCALGCEAPPCNSEMLIRFAMLRPEYVRSSANSYEKIATGLGKFTNWSGVFHGSPIEPPLYCNWQSKMIVQLAAWAGQPPPWINASNCVSEIAAFAAVLVARYPNLIYAVEPMNEPWYGPGQPLPWITSDQQFATFYAKLAQAVRTAVKAVDRKIQVWGPTLTNPFGGINQTLINAGVLRYLDAWDFHDYTLERNTVSVPSRASLLAAFRAQAPNVEIVLTECGFSDQASDQEVQAFVLDYRRAGCTMIMPTSLLGVYNGPVSTVDDEIMACWSDPVTKKRKLIAIEEALK